MGFRSREYNVMFELLKHQGSSQTFSKLLKDAQQIFIL